MFYNFCWFSCFEVCTWALFAVSVMKPFIWSHRFTSFYEYFLCLVFSTFIKAAHIKQWVTLLWFAAVEILFADKKKKGSVVHCVGQIVPSNCQWHGSVPIQLTTLASSWLVNPYYILQMYLAANTRKFQWSWWSRVYPDDCLPAACWVRTSLYNFVASPPSSVKFWLLSQKAYSSELQQQCIACNFLVMKTVLLAIFQGEFVFKRLSLGFKISHVVSSTPLKVLVLYQPMWQQP